MHDFTGKVALVTGAASGIGRETVRQFLESGARVCMVDRSSDAVGLAASELNGSGAAALPFTADVTDSVSVAGAVQACREGFGRLDYLVNAAGVAGNAARTDKMPDEEWRAVLDVNLTGTFMVMKHAVPLILESGGGAIVNLSSVAGLVATPHQIHYIASKFGVIGATKAAAIDYAAQGIRANVICPGGVRTPMLQQWLEADSDRAQFAAAGHPLGRLAEPREIAGPILWLCSDIASFITGAVIPVDGGFTIS